MEELTPQQLKEMIIFSAQYIEERKEIINKLNFFPVPDSDTGDNVSATLNSIRKALEQKSFDSGKEMIDAVLEAALYNSQGNSGIIYASCLNGFLSSLLSKSIYILLDLSLAFQKSSQTAFASVQNPVSGTILDTIEETSQFFQKASQNKETDIKKALHDLHKQLQNNFPSPLDESKKYDAGSYGFFLIIESYKKYLCGETETVSHVSHEPKNSHIKITDHMYEVMFILKDCVLKKEQLDELFEPLGNCLDILPIHSKIKIHIHTDFPYEVKDAAYAVGEIEMIQIINMDTEEKVL